MIILWSGGADSTLTLWRELERKHMAPRVLTIVDPSVPAAREQLRARVAITAELAKRGFVFDTTTVTLTSSNALGEKLPTGSYQGPLWMLAALMLREHEDLVLSWIHGEFAREVHLRAMFDATQRMQNKKGRLLMPLETMSKAEIVDELRKAGLYGLTWSCEGDIAATSYAAELADAPVIAEAPCGECDKCVELRTAESQLEHLAGCGSVPAKADAAREA